jgi:hypothetical protein
VRAFPDLSQVMLSNPSENNTMKRFTFDSVFDENSTQKDVYDCVGGDLLSHSKILTSSN